MSGLRGKAPIIAAIYLLASPAAGEQPERAEPQSANCPVFFFEAIGDLVGDAFTSSLADVAADGRRMVGNSYADDPLVPTDGGSGAPTFYPHAYQAVGYTRLCDRTSFFTGLGALVTTYPLGTFRSGLIGLGYLSPAAHAESTAYGISPDGQVVVGFATLGADSHTEPVIFEHTRISKLGLLSGHVSGAARDVSQTSPIKFDRWQAQRIWLGPLLARPPRRPRIVAGWSSLANNHPVLLAGSLPVYWDLDGTHALSVPASLPNGALVVSAEAVAVSDDGSVIAGNLYYDQGGGFKSYGCIWRHKSPAGFGPARVLDSLRGGDDDNRVMHISGHGDMAVGYGSTDGTPYRACQWNLSTGQAMALPEWNPAEYPWTVAQGVGDGSAIVFIVGFAIAPLEKPPYFKSRALRWTSNGPQAYDIADLLAAATPPVMVPDEWSLEAHRVSANGRVIVGHAWHRNPLDPDSSEWVSEGWVAGVP